MTLSLARNRFGFHVGRRTPGDVTGRYTSAYVISSAVHSCGRCRSSKGTSPEGSGTPAVLRRVNASRTGSRQGIGRKDRGRKCQTILQRTVPSCGNESWQIFASAFVSGDCGEYPQQIVAKLSQVVPNDHSVLFLEDVNGIPVPACTPRPAAGCPIGQIEIQRGGHNIYHIIAQQSELMVIPDVKNMQGWNQPEWLPEDRSWLGIPLHSKRKVSGMITLSRSVPDAFSQDEHSACHHIRHSGWDRV